MSPGNADQKAFWEEFAAVWVDKQDDLDALLAPVLAGVLERAQLQTGQRVLDIGCGTGTSTIHAAQAVGTDGHVVGADISAPMLERARTVAGDMPHVSFETADVAEYPFEPAFFDHVISRFGVMFFADPDAAFANILTSVRPRGRLTMACWSQLDKNPWFHVPMYAAKKRLGAPPPVDPDDPGPLAFRNTDRVIRILENAGYIDIKAEAVSLLLTPAGDLDHVASHATSIGPAARTIEFFEAAPEDVKAIAAEVATGFADYATPNGVHVPAEINFYTATAPRH